jgi:hypothetical protein
MDEIEKDEKGWECSTYQRNEKRVKFWSENL